MTAAIPTPRADCRWSAVDSRCLWRARRDFAGDGLFTAREEEQVWGQAHRSTAEQAEAWLRSLEAAGRYQQDVFA